MSRPVRFVPPSSTTQLLGRPQDAPIGVSIWKAFDRTRTQPEERKKIERLAELRRALKDLLSSLNLRSSERFVLEIPVKENFPVEYTEEAKRSFQQIEVDFSGREDLQKVLELVNQLKELQISIRVPPKPGKFGGGGILESESEKSSVRKKGPATPGTVKRSSSAKKKLPFTTTNFDEDDDDDVDVDESRLSFVPVSPPTKTTTTFVPPPPPFSPQKQPVIEQQPATIVLPPPPPPPAATAATAVPVTAVPAIAATTPATAAVQKEEISDSEWAVRSMASAINSLLQRALVPLLDALGGVAFALGRDDIRTLMVYQQPEKLRPCARDLPMERLRIIDELDPELKTVSYLIQRYEPILGGTFLRTYLQQAMESLDRKGEQIVKEEKTKTIESNACFDFDRDLKHPVPNLPNPRSLANLKAIQQPSPRVREKIAELEAAQEASQALRLTDAEARFAPAWAFSVLNNSVFRAVASPGMLAAFEMAHNQVRTFPGCSSFTLKELLCSKETMNQFVFLAARHYMRDISVLAPQGAPQGGGGGGRRKGGNYINVNQARKELQERAFIISIWFERVYAVPNPLLNEFDKYRQKLRDDMIVQIAPNLYASYPLAQEFEARMTLYRDALPQRELRHRD